MSVRRARVRALGERLRRGEAARLPTRLCGSGPMGSGPYGLFSDAGAIELFDVYLYPSPGYRPMTTAQKNIALLIDLKLIAYLARGYYRLGWVAQYKNHHE